MTDTNHPLTDDFARDAAENVIRPNLALVRSSPFSQVRELAEYLDDLDKIAQVMCKATILPREMQAPANLKLVLMQGLEMGFTPLQAIRASFVIVSKEGTKVGYYVAALVALVHRSKVCRFFRVDETTSERCRVLCARKDEPEDVVHPFELTMDAARKARFDVKPTRDEKGALKWETKYPWLTAPADMLMWRCAGRAVKAVFPDVVFGMATPDELDDLESARALEQAGGFAPIPTTARGVRYTDEHSQEPERPSRKPDLDVVDAEILTDDAIAAAGARDAHTAPEQPEQSDYPPAPAPDERSGDAGWDTFLETLRTAAGIDTRGWLPTDLMKAWNAKVDAVRTRQQLNLLGPWIGEISKHAASSKTCAECAAAMKASFNAATVALRKSEKPA